MKKHGLKSLVASIVGVCIAISISPTYAFADFSKEDIYSSKWVEYKGKKYATGCVLEPFSAELYEEKVQSRITYTDLPSAIDLSNTPHFPPLRNQKTVNACASFAAVSHQFTYEMAKLNNWNLKSLSTDSQELNKYIFSPMWAYNYTHIIQGGEDVGSTIPDVYSILSTLGAATEAEFPFMLDEYTYNNTFWCQDRQTQLNALQYRISNYVKHSYADYSDQTPIDNGINSEAILEMKSIIADGHMILFVAPSVSFSTVELPDKNNETAVLFSYVPKGSTLGDMSAHALTIVGYDDTISYDMNNNKTIDPWEQGAFKVANSWGTSWENDGFIWIMYDSLNKKSAGEDFDDTYVENGKNTYEVSRMPIVASDWPGYSYYTIEVETYDPSLLAQVTISMSDQTNSTYRLSVGTNSLETAEDRSIQWGSTAKLTKARPDITQATFLLDFTPIIGTEPYNNRWYIKCLSSSSIPNKTVVHYQIRYYYKNAIDYQSQSVLAYKQIDASKSRDFVTLNLQPTPNVNSFMIDHEKEQITISYAMDIDTFKNSFMGGELVYDLKGLSYVPTGATIQQKLFNRVYATYTTVLYGDINGDAAIDQNDVNLLQQYVNGQASLNGPYKEAAHIVRYYYGGTSDEITQRDVDLLSQRINEYKDIAEGYYTIQNSTNSLYLEKTDYEGGKPVRIHTASDDNGQIFKIEPTGDPGYYRIRAAFKPSFVLTCNVNTDNVTLSYQDDDKTKDKQIWSIAYDEKGISFIPFQNPQKALALENGGTQAGTKAKLVNRTSATPTKYWIATKTIPKMTVPQGVYSVTSLANAQFYLDAKDAGTTNDTPVRTYSSTGGNHQKWFFKYHAEDGYYSIHPLHRPSICLTLSDTSSYKTVLQWDSGLATQRWMVIEGKNGDFRLAPASSLSQVLMTERADRYSYLKLGADNLAGDVSNQTKWLFTATLPNPTVHEGYYSFRNKNSGKCMDIDTHKAGALAPVVQYSEGVYDTQMWHVRQSSDGYYILSTVYDSRFVLCTDGERVYLSPEAGSQDDSIKWLFIQSDDGTYRLSPKNYPSQAAVVLNASHSDSARLILWDDNQSTNGRWTLFDPTNYTDGDYTFTWQDDGMSEPRYMTSGRVFSESSGGYPYSTVLYNGTYTQYSSWKVEYQGDGYYTIKNNGNYGDSYEHYLSYDGAVVRCEISENPQEDDSIYWVITKEGLLIPKSYPDYAISVYGRSASDTQLSATNITSQDVIHWSIKK